MTRQNFWRERNSGKPPKFQQMCFCLRSTFFSQTATYSTLLLFHIHLSSCWCRRWPLLPRRVAYQAACAKCAKPLDHTHAAAVTWCGIAVRNASGATGRQVATKPNVNDCRCIRRCGFIAWDSTTQFSRS